MVVFATTRYRCAKRIREKALVLYLCRTCVALVIHAADPIWTAVPMVDVSRVSPAYSVQQRGRDDYQLVRILLYTLEYTAQVLVLYRWL